MPRTAPPADALANVSIDPRLAKAASHPLRMRILTILEQRVASPTELATELGEVLGNVSYHTRKLLALDCIELVREERRRGAIEHYYRATKRPIVTTDDLAKVPLQIRRGLADGVLRQIAKDLRNAARSGGFDRLDIHLTRTPLALDEEGWAVVADRLLEVLGEAVDLQAECAQRVAERKQAARDAGEDPDAIPDTIAANLVMLLFEQRFGGKKG